MDDFCVFILTNGRADNVITVKTLERCGYTGRIIFLVDDLDPTVNRYINNFGKENIYIFNKQEIADESDLGDNFNEMRTITHARTASFYAAKALGIKNFIQLDDDYTGFRYRLDNEKKYKPKLVTNLDRVFEIIMEFYEKSGAHSVAMGQGGDYMGTTITRMQSGILTLRKCMNSFFCGVDRQFKYLGTMNEDVNTYTRLGAQGLLFFTILHVSLEQLQTQSQAGGITELYKDKGTYVKSFYTVMFSPSSVKVGILNTSNARIHHKINWAKTVPCILSEDLKK